MGDEPTTPVKNPPRSGAAWRPALLIALIYGAAGALWVLFADQLLAAQAPPPGVPSLFRGYQVLIFTVLSGGFVFLLVWMHARRAKAAELALRQSESYYRTVINRAQEGFWRIGADHRTVGVNDALCEMLGYRRSDILDRTPFDFVDDRNRPVFEEQLAQARHTAADRDYEITLRHKDGRPVPALFHATTLWDEQGRPVGSYAFVTDIRQMKRVEESLQRSNRALRTVSGGNRALLRAVDESGLARQTCRVAVEQGGYSAAWVGLSSEGEGPITTAAYWGLEPGEAQTIEATLRDPQAGCPLDKAFKTGQVQLRAGETDEQGATCLRKIGVDAGAMATLPLADDSTRGLLVLFTDAPFDFDAEEVRLLQELAGDLAYGLSSLRVRDREKQHLERLRMAGTVFESTAEGILVTDAQERIVSVNRAFTEITGYSEQEILGKTPRILQSGRQDTDFYRAMWEGLKRHGRWHGEVWNRRKDGSVYPEWLTISAVYDEQGALTHFIGVFSDISRLKQSEEELDFLVYHDPLTGLPNRLLFQERAEHALQRAARESGGVAVCTLDLSGFRNINDTRGHTAGDEALKVTAERIRGVLRREDSLARMGGDNFLLLLEDTERGEQAAMVAQKVLAQFEQPFHIGGDEFYLNARMGISLFPRDAQDIASLIRNADAAMNRAKHSGQDRFEFYSQDLTAAAVERVRLEKSFRKALQQDEFTLVYQPQFELATGCLTGIEALVRWEHPEQGLITPDRFIPLAEESGLIEPLGELVLDKAVNQVRTWRAAHRDPGILSVNISARQLQQESRFFDHLTRKLSEETSLAGLLELEVTEQALMRDIGQASAELTRLRELGIGIAIDDFGTGYSSLNYLKHLPVTRLKIDKSFVDDVPGNPSDEAIVRTIIGMGDNLGLGVIAEGVETPEQAAFLQRQGCQQAQGYCYSKPLPPAAFEAEYLEETPAGDRDFDRPHSREHT